MRGLNSPLVYGNVIKGSLVGPGYTDWDAALHRYFKFTEKVNLQFRAEYFNVLNHTNFGNPGAHSVFAQHLRANHRDQFQQRLHQRPPHRAAFAEASLLGERCCNPGEGAPIGALSFRLQSRCQALKPA